MTGKKHYQICKKFNIEFEESDIHYGDVGCKIEKCVDGVFIDITRKVYGKILYCTAE